MRQFRVSVLMQISAAHFISHVYIMLIPALLPLLPDSLGVGYVDLGLAASLFSALSALLQAPIGFIVDRVGPWRVLISGIALGTVSCLLMALAPSYWGLLVVASVLGAANAVYHPADYAILSRAIRDSVMGRAFSVHSFAGYAGSAITPFVAVFTASFWGLSAAFFVFGLFGVAVLGLIFLARPKEREATCVERATPSTGKVAGGGLAAVFTLPILVLTFLYILLSLSTWSLERFSVAALVEGYGVALPLANTALTAFLFLSAIGVLCGGSLADRTRRHGYVAALAFGVGGVLTAIVALGILPDLALVPILAVIGFLTGIIVPSRDMLVRAASPKGYEGRTFGVVSSGFNIGGMLGPPFLGYFLDHGMEPYIFWSAVAFMGLTVVLTLFQESRKS